MRQRVWLAAILMTAFAAGAQTPAQEAQKQVKELADSLLSKPVKDEDAYALLMAWQETADGAYFKAAQAAVDSGSASLGAALIVDRVLATKKYDDIVAELRARGGSRSIAEELPEITSVHTGGFSSQDAPLIAWAKSSNKPEATRVYALAKGARLGLLPASDGARTVKMWAAVQASEPVSVRLLAASEIAQSDTAMRDRGKLVMVDAWFNSQTRPAQDGSMELFHYKWTDERNSGFSFFGRAFQRYGAKLGILAEEPTLARLKDAKVYVIPSPDIPSKNPKPHYVNKADGDAIEAWVRAGGVLLLMQNDKTNAEFEHFNTLSERFGIHFNPVLRNAVEGNHFEQGQLNVSAGTGGIFPIARQVYMKEICTITVSGPAKPIYTDKGDVLMALAHVGKGTVYAVVDPWLYNEYTDGRKLPPDFQNFAAAKDLAGWALTQTH